MVKHALKLLWRRKRSNGLLVLEFLLTFLVTYYSCVLIFDGIHRYLLPDGFDIDNVVSIVAFRSQYAAGSEDSGNLYPRFAHTLKDMPFVGEVGLMHRELYDNRFIGDFLTIKGTRIRLSSANLSDSCKDILNVHVVQGRWFSEEDDAGTFEPIVINSRLRDVAFDGDSPLDKIINEKYRVIGVVSYFRIFGKYQESQPLFIERTTFDNPGRARTLVVKLSVEPNGELISRMLAALQATAPDWTFIITPAEELRANRIKEEASPYFISGITASTLISMVILGIFGVLWQNIARRTREIGLRRAKGATIGHIYKQLISEMVLVTSIGVGLGILIVAQLIMIGILGYIQIGIHVSAIGTAAMLLYLTVIACSLYPGYLATRINPAQALHYE